MTDRRPLSFAQEQLWFLDRMMPADPTYNLPYLCRLSGPLDVEALRLSLEKLVHRHDSLRTRFDADDGVPFAIVDPPQPVTLHEIAPHDVDGEIAAAFDLAEGPLWRAALARVEVDEWVFCFTVHHIVTDGWSLGTMARELGALYRGEDMPPLSVRYTDFALRQRERLDSGGFADSLKFWERHLDGLVPLELPMDRPRPLVRGSGGDSVQRRLRSDLCTALRTLATANGASLFMVLTAGLSALFSRYTGQDDIALGMATAGRAEPLWEPVVGLFVNLAMLRLDLSGDPSFKDLVERVAEAAFDIYDHQAVPFEKVVEHVQPERDPGRNPLFQVSVQLLSAPPALDLPRVRAEPFFRSTGTSRFDLAVDFVQDDTAAVTVRIEYSTELFDRWRIEALLEHLENLLASVASHPDSVVSKVDVLSPQEVARLRAAGRGELLALPQTPIRQRIAAQPADSDAAVCRGKRMTYGELDARAEQLAVRLRAAGVKPGQVVAIALHRDLEALVAIVGALEAGAAFTLLDPSHPPARLEFQLSDSGATVLIDSSGIVVQPDGGAVNSQSLVYLLYTSGSTGKPKGVLIEEEALTCFVEAYQRAMRLGPGERMLQCLALTFDFGLGEIFAGLTCGATLVLVAPEEAESPTAIAELMRRERVGYAGFTPAMLTVLEPGPYPDLRVISVGGDVLPAESVNRWNQLGRQVFNVYGPTEAAVTCTHHECDRREWTRLPPIGRPQFNRELYVVDRFDNLAPQGVPGELLIGGKAGLAAGYLNRPELTAEKFVADPFEPARRVYRSGDLVRWNRDLELEFLGRLDTQVKVRGRRIELGEIESVLLGHPKVERATVVARQDPAGEMRLVGYLTGGDPDTVKLSRYLAILLPEYMVPSAWVVLDSFPMTSSGKVDRKRLPDPAWRDAEPEFTAPDTPAQRWLADTYAEILGLQQVSASANFFRMGGTSLQAMRVVARINSAFRADVNVRLLFGAADIRAVAKVIEGLERLDDG